MIPIGREEYECLMGDMNAFRAYLDQLIEQHPELFPARIKQGYRWYGLYPRSTKMAEVRMRRIRLSAAPASEVFTIAPSFILPYGMGQVEDVEKAFDAEIAKIQVDGVTEDEVKKAKTQAISGAIVGGGGGRG